MRLPRDVLGEALAQALKAFGYTITRQTGSHLRLTTQTQGEHHITIPRHPPCASELSPRFWPRSRGTTN